EQTNPLCKCMFPSTCNAPTSVQKVLLGNGTFLERVAGHIELVCAHQAAAAEEAENQRQLAVACMDLCSRLLGQGCDLSPFISPARLVAIADLPSRVLTRMIMCVCGGACAVVRVRWCMCVSGQAPQHTIR